MPATLHPPGGAFDGAVHRLAVRAYYKDTDTGGIVYHANYLKWFERARTDMLRLLGIELSQTIAAGTGTYVVAEANLRFLGSARLDDIVVIASEVVQARHASVRMRQTASINSEPITEADIRVGFVTPEGRPRRQPDGWLDAFRSVMTDEET